MKLSTKRVKQLSEIVGNKKFRIPVRHANDRNPISGKPCILVMIGGKSTYVDVEEPTDISYEVFCVLKDSGIINKNRSYEEGEEFNPV